MKVNYECAHCMLRQTIEATEHAVESNDKRMDVTLKVLDHLHTHFKKNVRSNKLGTDLHHIVMNETGNKDPYKTLREDGNRIAIKLIPLVEESLQEDDSLENYVKVAVAGNIIDFGAYDQNTNMKSLIQEQISKDFIINDIDKLDQALREADTIVYLADNGGEIVFDKFLIQKIKQDYDVNIILALKESPIINDVVVKDAEDLGLDEYAELKSTGAASVGIVEEYISDEMKNLLDNCDFIISKGMGNYEGLTEMTVKSPVFYLLNTKCPVISREIGVEEKSSVVIKRDPE